jgi:hypothetical protein
MRIWAAAALALSLAGCTPPNAPTEPAAPAAESEVSVTGVVSAIEDGAYPMFVVKVRPEGAAEDLSLSLNAEDADLGGAQPSSFAGQSVDIRYSTAPENNLSDLRANGRSLVEAEGEPSGEGFTGVLSGADAVSGGDLPDLVAVTNAQGERVEFAYFITEAMVAANGREVTAYYVTEPRDTIISMRPAGGAD